MLTPETFPQRLAAVTLFVVVSSTGEIVGTIAYATVGEDEGHIHGMAVLPDFQGKALGGAVASKG